MREDIYRCYIFNREQEDFLRSKRYKIDRMECFLTLVDKVCLRPTQVTLSVNRQVELHPGQFLANDVECSKLWKLDRKTCAKLMKQMIDLRLFSAHKEAEVTVYSMHALSGWFVGGEFVKNEFYKRPKPQQSQTL